MSLALSWGAQGPLECGKEGVESFVCSPLSGVSKKVSDTELGVARATWGWATGGPLQTPCYLLAAMTPPGVTLAFPPGCLFHSHVSLPDADYPVDPRRHTPWSI